LNHSVSITRGPAIAQSGSKPKPRAAALWGLSLLAILMVLVALMADASITPEQRIALFQQSGFFP
jgi:hypothetical protein